MKEKLKEFFEAAINLIIVGVFFVVMPIVAIASFFKGCGSSKTSSVPSDSSYEYYEDLSYSYDDGYEKGYDEGYDKGNLDGYMDGYDDGYNESGYEDGYDMGYKEGYNDAYNEILEMIEE